MTSEISSPVRSNNHIILNRILSRSSHKNSLVMSIAEQVGLAIIDGHLLPGDDLNSVDLSNQYNTSRTPVREALLLLQKEGLVEIPPRRRPRVAHLSIKEVRDIYQVRANLYGLVAELIVSSATDEDIHSLKEFLEPMNSAMLANDLDTYFWLNVDFQNRETEICGNEHVKRILESLMLRMLQLRYLSLSLPGRIQQSFSDHQSLYRAYQERNASLAVALKRGIVLRGLANIEKVGWTGLNISTQDE